MTAAALAISAILVAPEVAALRAHPDRLPAFSLFAGVLIGAFAALLVGWTSRAEGAGWIRNLWLAGSVLIGVAAALAAALGAACAAGWAGRTAFGAASLLSLAVPAAALRAAWRARGEG